MEDDDDNDEDEDDNEDEEKELMSTVQSLCSCTRFALHCIGYKGKKLKTACFTCITLCKLCYLYGTGTYYFKNIQTKCSDTEPIHFNLDLVVHFADSNPDPA